VILRYSIRLESHQEYRDSMVKGLSQPVGNAHWVQARWLNFMLLIMKSHNNKADNCLFIGLTCFS
jgi:hypothetical protein